MSSMLQIAGMGVRAYQSMLDVTANNLANADTTGFKGDRMTFAELFAQTIRPAGGATETRGSVNPAQIGMGVVISSIDRDHTQGNINSTGRDFDFALEGRGYFVVNDGARTLYTRDGSFGVDAEGYLVDPSTGFRAQRLGHIGEAEGFQAAGDFNIRIPFDTVTPGQSSETVRFSGNLNADAEAGYNQPTNIHIYDSLGNTHSLTANFEKIGANEWEVSFELEGAGAIDPVSLTFGEDGSIVAGGEQAITIDWTGVDGVESPQEITLNFGREGYFDGVTQMGGNSTAGAVSQDGFGYGTLQSISLGGNGVIRGTFSNGVTQNMAALSIATVDNDHGLERVGSNYYELTAAAGEVLYSMAGEGRAGVVRQGALENSNVDISQEFTNLIMAQRGFQVNSRSIRAGNNMIQQLVNVIS